MGGVPCVAGTRIPVATVVGSVAGGLTTDEILAEYPQLTRDDIQACLAYAAGNADVRELLIRADAARIHDLLAEAAATPLPGGWTATRRCRCSRTAGTSRRPLPDKTSSSELPSPNQCTRR